MDDNRIDEVNLDTADDSSKKSVLSVALKIILIMLVLFCVGNIAGSLTNIQRVNNFSTQNNNPEITTTVPSTTEMTTLPEATTTEPTTETTTRKTTETTTTEPPTTEDVTPDTKEEIIALFNKSANNIKKNAGKITRNYEDRRHDESLSDYPIVLSIVALPLIESWLVKHDTPVEYTEKKIINANYPVKGEAWVSKLKADDVAEAKCVERDGKYEIEIKLVYCKDPAENEGVGAVMELVTLEKVQELAPIVKKCETEYYDCAIRCTVEKDTGNMVYAKYTQPMILNMTTKRLTELQAVFAMTFESEYVIEY